MNKYQFISNLPGQEAIKLANAIYQTYLVEDSSHLQFSVKRLCEIYNFEFTQDTFCYFKTLFAELNEPVAVTDFTYKGDFYKWLVLDFCSFENEWKFEDEYINIAINEIYLSAMKELMQEPFIEFHED
jgi:hypothetical protein